MELIEPAPTFWIILSAPEEPTDTALEAFVPLKLYVVPPMIIDEFTAPSAVTTELAPNAT